ncbi:MAG TPA: hypothetical protein VGD50_07155, partial [Candidatus Baltobacteraceae bacterium]
LTFNGLISEATARSSSNRTLGTSALGMALDMGTATRFAVDVGDRSTLRRSGTQAFGDASLTRHFTRTMLLAIGLGTTFNSMQNTKAHYLAAGITLAQ